MLNPALVLLVVRETLGTSAVFIHRVCRPGDGPLLHAVVGGGLVEEKNSF